MRHPVTQLMTAMMGSANGMLLHRAVIRALRDAGSPNPLESAAILEHLIYLQAEQGEWVIFPVEEAPDVVFTPARTFQRLTAWLKVAKLLESKRGIRTYKGQSGNFTLYRPDLGTLSEMLGCGAFESADMARSKSSEVARSTSISRNKRELARNLHFDAIVTALYPQGKISNASHVARVAKGLQAAEWTPEDIHHVLSAVQRDTFWKKALTLGSFEKHAEDWRRRYGRARKEETGPPVVTDETTPADDLDWTGME